MRLVAYIYRCQTCGYEFRAEAGEQTMLMCSHPSPSGSYYFGTAEPPASSTLGPDFASSVPVEETP